MPSPFRTLLLTLVLTLIGLTAAAQPAPPSSVPEREKQPPFGSLAYFLEKPEAFAAFVSALASIIAVGASVGIAGYSSRIAKAANGTAKSALEASQENIKTLVKIERPYITGGGGWVRTAVNGYTGQVLAGNFVVNVKNNGKTPALLTHFFVDFANLASLPVSPDYQTKHVHYDWLGANEQKNRIKMIDIPFVNGQPPDVIYGAFHYKDFDHKEHYFRFILKIGPATTHPDIALDVPGAYSHWS
jgi:hypothetical protein